jgi:hypothetical protein
MFYPKTLESYEPIFGSIGNSLGVKLNISRRKIREHYNIEVTSAKSREILRAYSFPY